MTRYLLTPAARDDLLELAEFIREDRPQAAARVLRELREAMRRVWLSRLRLGICARILLTNPFGSGRCTWKKEQYAVSLTAPEGQASSSQSGHARAFARMTRDSAFQICASTPHPAAHTS